MQYITTIYISRADIYQRRGRHGYGGEILSARAAASTHPKLRRIVRPRAGTGCAFGARSLIYCTISFSRTNVGQRVPSASVKR